MLSKKKVGKDTSLLNHLMLKFNILKWLKLWKQMTQISAVYNCCCRGCWWLRLLSIFPWLKEHRWFSLNLFRFFLIQWGPDFVKKLEFKNNLRTNLKKWPFSSIFQAAKKFQNNSRNPKNSRTDSHADNTVRHNTIFSWFTEW